MDDPMDLSSDEGVDISSDEGIFSNVRHQLFDQLDCAYNLYCNHLHLWPVCLLNHLGVYHRMKKKKSRKTCRDVCACPRKYTICKACISYIIHSIVFCT